MEGEGLRKCSGAPFGVSKNACLPPFVKSNVFSYLRTASPYVSSVGYIFPSEETANQGRNIPCPFRYTRQLANYLNYSFVNITSFTQPLFAVSKKELKDLNSCRSLGSPKKVFLFAGGLMVRAASHHHIYRQQFPGPLQDWGLCMQDPRLSFFGLAISHMNKYTQIYTCWEHEEDREVLEDRENMTNLS